MGPRKAARLLGIARLSKPKVIHRAFKEKAKSRHPDAGGDGGDLAELREARTVLLEYVKRRGTVVACESCDGTGKRGQFKCMACNGNGKVRKQLDADA